MRGIGGRACHGWRMGQILQLRADAHVMSECSDQEEAPPVVTLWGRQRSREELLARAGRLEQMAGMRLVDGGDGAERGVRLLGCTTGAGLGFEIPRTGRCEHPRRYRMASGNGARIVPHP